jgi:hypothetical protein
MLNKDYAGTNSRIGLGAIQNATVVGKDRPDLGKALADAYSQYDSYNKQQALTEALKNNDQNAINNAMADINPMAYAQMLKSDAQRAEDRKWALDDMATKHQNDLALVRAKDKEATALQRNFNFIKQTTGLPDDDIVKIIYGGQNPTLNMALLGEKGAKKADETTGKNYAADMETYRSMTSKLPALEETVGKLNDLSQTATYTTTGQLYDLLRKEFNRPPRQSAVDRAEYISIVDNQILPLLRDTFGAAFTQKEGESLKNTLGDPNKTPKEKQVTLKSFINQKKNDIESQYRKIQSYGINKQATDEDAWGGI